jgi:hypothetical protein
MMVVVVVVVVAAAAVGAAGQRRFVRTDAAAGCSVRVRHTPGRSAN